MTRGQAGGRPSCLRILIVSRMPLRECWSNYRQRRHHLADYLAQRGHRVVREVIRPSIRASPYVAYPVAMLRSFVRLNRESRAVLVADDMESSVVALALHVLRRWPFVFCFRDDYALLARDDVHRIRRYLVEMAEYVVPRLATLVVVTDAQKRRFCRSLGVASARLALVPNGVDTRCFRPGESNRQMRRRLGLGDDPVILFRGKLTRYYRLELVLQAMVLVTREVPDARCLLVGAGPDKTRLKALAEELDLEEQVTFPGYVPQDDLVQLIQTADACVYPLPNGSALALGEYLACGKPVVMPRGRTRKMSSADLSVAPVVLVPWSAVGFARGISMALGQPEMARRAMKEGPSWVRTHLQWDAITEHMEQLLERVY